MTLSLYNFIKISPYTDNPPSTGKVGHTARVYTAFSFQTVVLNQISESAVRQLDPQFFVLI